MATEDIIIPLTLWALIGLLALWNLLKFICWILGVPSIKLGIPSIKKRIPVNHPKGYFWKDNPYMEAVDYSKRTDRSIKP